MFAKLPLTALRAFESAARLGGFKAAAQELAITPAAISHQVKSLETWLGLQLFARTGQGVRLSEDGQRLQRQVQAALQGLQQGLAVYRRDIDPQRLNLTTTAAFASLWLIPRLGEFHRLHPHVQVRVQTSMEIIDLHRDASLDLALRASFADDPSLFRLGLFDEHFCAYAPPGWRMPGSDEPIELVEAPWVSGTVRLLDWAYWCELAGHPDWLGRAIRHRYDDEQYALQAAMAGHGLVLASDVLASDSLARGLLQPLREDIRLPAARYEAVCVPGREREPAIRAFLDWLGGVLQRPQGHHFLL